MGVTPAGAGGQPVSGNSQQAGMLNFNVVGPFAVKVGETSEYKIALSAPALKGAIFSWTISGPDGVNSLSGQTIKFTPKDKGEYVLTAKVATKSGATREVSLKVTVFPPPSR